MRTVLILFAVVLSQQPAIGEPSAIFVKGTQATRSSFCKSSGLLSCLQIKQADCDARIVPIVDNCAKDPGPGIAGSQNEGLVRGFLTGCALTAFLAGNPRANEAIACIQQAGKK